VVCGRPTPFISALLEILHDQEELSNVRPTCLRCEAAYEGSAKMKFKHSRVTLSWINKTTKMLNDCEMSEDCRCFVRWCGVSDGCNMTMLLVSTFETISHEATVRSTTELRWLQWHIAREHVFRMPPSTRGKSMSGFKDHSFGSRIPISVSELAASNNSFHIWATAPRPRSQPI